MKCSVANNHVQESMKCRFAVSYRQSIAEVHGERAMLSKFCQLDSCVADRGPHCVRLLRLRDTAVHMYA